MAMTTLAVHAQASKWDAPVSESAMVRLIRGLIESGTLTKDVGEALLAQAQTEAMAAQHAQRQAASATGASANALQPAAGDVRVPYISQTVRDEIRNDIKGEVMAQAKAEGWAAPNETPEWTQRIRFEGDLRVRSESRFFSEGNSNEIVGYAAINEGNGYDVNTNSTAGFPPLLNTRQNRKNQLRARARIGLAVDISDATKAGVRLASGSDDSPVSTTQTLGGGLGKKNVWLDQAWLSHKPYDWLTITGGRFANPFVSTDLLFSSDLNLDGIALQYQKPLPSNRDVELFGTVGIVPLEYSSDNFPSRSLDKASSEVKWLLGVQAGASWKVDERNRLRGALAYYDFRNVNGRLSSPCALYAGAEACSTDWARPAFMQKGNTLMMLRDIMLNPNDPANTAQPQYFGLASKFQLLDLNMRWDTKVAGAYGLRLDANFVRNLAYEKDAMFRRARGGIINNYAANAPLVPTQADFQSGGNAYMLQATLGKPSPAARGDWNILAGYKRIEPDAMPDGYNDSSFHLGGTNARGYYIGGSYAIDKNTWFTGRWMSTKEVYGAPYQIDMLQLEFNARF
ncbi:putative porin [Comamonas terrigena]|uniref:putative porin n=1 Tax=Comamonas terrigena TaxID=32013 RepID=UPI00244D4C85|nr:putative porin [Comamonas terrigena]MDH0051243.1 putative porin [Comamonas terrigena]MDH0513692.1 putative porin [Comamonas terrigena]MDH1093194.1 putative porin [Comamonas terrigena]